MPLVLISSLGTQRLTQCRLTWTPLPEHSTGSLDAPPPLGSPCPGVAGAIHVLASATEAMVALCTRMMREGSLALSSQDVTT